MALCGPLVLGFAQGSLWAVDFTGGVQFERGDIGKMLVLAAVLRIVP